MPGDEHLELGDELCVSPAIEVCVDSGFEAGGYSSSSLAASARANGSWNSASGSPRQSESASRNRSRGECGVPCCMRRFALEPQPLEPDEVDGRRIDLDRVTGRSRAEHPLGQDLTQLRDVDLHHLLRRLGNLLAPEVVDEPLGRDRPVGVEQQAREQRALLASCKDVATDPSLASSGPRRLNSIVARRYHAFTAQLPPSNRRRVLCA